MSNKGSAGVDPNMVIDGDAEEEQSDTSPTSAVSSDIAENDEEPDMSKHSGKMRGFSQDKEKIRLSFKEEVAAAAAARAGAKTPDGKRRHKDADDDSSTQRQPKTVTPEELTKMMKDVERLVKDQEKTEEIQDGHTRVLRRLMIERRRE